MSTSLRGAGLQVDGGSEYGAYLLATSNEGYGGRLELTELAVF